MSTLGERVAAQREDQGLTQTELAKRVTLYGFKISQQGIAQIERRGDTRPKCIVELAAALEVNAEWLKTGKGLKFAGNTQRPAMDPEAQALALRELEDGALGGRWDVPIWASIDGPGGKWLVEPNDRFFTQRILPLMRTKDCFTCTVLGRNAEPIYQQGDQIFVNPLRVASAGDDCLFLGSRQRGGLYPAMIGRVVAFPDDGWLIYRGGTAEELVLRSDWPTVGIIVAKYNKI